MSKRIRATIHELIMQTASTAPGNLEILRGLLFNQGIKANEIIETEQWPYKSLSLYFRSLEKARALQKSIRSWRLNELTLKLKTLHRKDWQTKWKNEFKPFALTRTFEVVPTAYRHTHRLRGRVPIYIDTDEAFGTGLHATTRFMAQFIERCRGRFESFLDLGTGTGILAMIAVKCGASDVMAIDIDRTAVEVARHNCERNRCADIHIRHADAHQMKDVKRYDFVAANIITQELIRLAPRLVGFVKPGQYLALSGVSVNNFDIFRAAFRCYPLRCLKIEKGEGWVGILFQRASSRRGGS